MTNFNISILELDPIDPDRFRLKLITYGDSIFLAARHILDADILFSTDDTAIRIRTSSIVDFLFKLTHSVFAMNFSLPEGEVQRLSGRRYVRPHTFDNNFSINFSTQNNLVDFEFLSREAVITSPTKIDPGTPMNISIPLGQFNREVFRAYQEVVKTLETLMGELDGFEESFCQIPFRANIYNLH